MHCWSDIQSCQQCSIIRVLFITLSDHRKVYSHRWNYEWQFITLIMFRTSSVQFNCIDVNGPQVEPSVLLVCDTECCILCVIIEPLVTTGLCSRIKVVIAESAPQADM